MKSGLALFDFDGTITSADSARLFYRSLYRNKVVFLYRHIMLCLPELISYRFGWTDYLKLKRKRLQLHVGMLSDDDYKRHLLHFQQLLLPSMIKSNHGINPVFSKMISAFLLAEPSAILYPSFLIWPKKSTTPGRISDGFMLEINDR